MHAGAVCCSATCGARLPSCGSTSARGQQGYTHATMDELMEHVPIPSKLRDELGMVLFPGDPGAVGATVTRSCAGLNWLGGEDAGEGRFVTSREVLHLWRWNAVG